MIEKIGGNMGREQLVDMLNNVIHDAYERIIKILEAGNSDNIEKVKQKMENLRYYHGQEPKPEDYEDPVFCDLYLIRFGYAYAFEYSVIYDAVIRSYFANEIARNGDHVLGVTSLACGTMIDAWGLAYALACIKEKGDVSLPDDMKIVYHGEDLTRWNYLFAGEDVDSVLNNYFKYAPKTYDLGDGVGAAEFFRKRDDSDNYKNYHWLNVITFAKFLGELASNDVSEIEDALKEVVENGCYAAREWDNRNEYYICFSHSASTIDNVGDDRRLSEVALKVINCLNANNDFEVDKNVLNLSSYCDEQDHNGEDVGVICCNEEGIPMYEFTKPYPDKNGTNKPYGQYIKLINKDFWNDQRVNVLKDKLYRLFSENNIEGRKPIERTTHFRFQVVKLARREG